MKENILVRSMATRKSILLPLLALAGTMLISSVASAQVDDWPALKGYSSRTGYNADAGPGFTYLNWFTPNSPDSKYVNSLLVDNTDDPSVYPAYPVNTIGTFSFSGATWNADPFALNQNNQDAAEPYLEPVSNTNSSERAPAYLTSTTVPMDNPQFFPNETPATKATASATWTFTPTTGPNLYALYVWVPVGPQVNQSANPATQYPQRYFTYSISTSAGSTVFETIDTYASGGGFIRLGNGGFSTNMVYPYDGINPIKITLYNTIPYGSTGKTSQLVYADAAMCVPTNGFYNASPVSSRLVNPDGTVNTIDSPRVVAALNQFSSGGVVAASGSRSAFTTLITGVVSSYPNASPTPTWNYSPTESSANAVVWDVSLSNSSPNNTWVTDPTLPKKGTNTAEYDVLGTPGAQDPTTFVYGFTDAVTYAPPLLNTGTYQIYAYVPGNDATHTYGAGVQYVITENGVQHPYFVDQTVAGGWVKIGDRRFSNTQTTSPLSVMVTNVSYNAVTGNDVGKKVYADEVIFVGEQNQAITSTPVMANCWVYNHTLGKDVFTQVVVVADENGVIHCLDSAGNADGTTTEYWSYPSTLGATDTDPNAVADASSEMPTGFGFSSGVVVQTPGIPADSSGNPNSYLYIGSTNGRVYCIDMDGNAAAPVMSTGIGTTKRVWTYPASPGANGNLGPFQGSVAYGAPGNIPTIYAPSVNGRMYALNAIGNAGAHTTNEIWQYPAKNSQTIGAITMTPVYAEFNGSAYLYFGTNQNTADDSNGVFYCMKVNNASTASGPFWTYAGGNITDAITLATLAVPTLSFTSSPAVVEQDKVNATYTNADGFVYVLNQNGYVYCFDAVTGAFASSSTATPIPWNPTNELNVGSQAGISFTKMQVYQTSGALGLSPVITIPTPDNRFEALFADPLTSNLDGTRQAWFRTNLPGPVVANMAISNNWMYGADQGGFLYAFSNTAGSGSLGNAPGSEGISENNPAGDAWRLTQVDLVTQAGYNLLRLPTGQNLTYLQALSPTYKFVRKPLAFEWGETVYLLVHDFPFATTDTKGNPVPPPIVNVSFSSGGKTIRSISVEARQFTDVNHSTNPPLFTDPITANQTLLDGYAVLAFPFQSGGNQSLPPGSGTITVSLSTSSLNTFGAQQTVAQNQRNGNARQPYYVANPIALSMPDPSNNGLPGTDILSIGLSNSPSNPENLVNGSPAINAGLLAEPSKVTQLLGTSAGIANHGTSIIAPVYVIDRSMMGLMVPDGTGLGEVRVDVKNLAWQGGRQAIYKPLNPLYYANFEDYPDNYPNTSLDYPDIQTTQIQVVKDPNGTPANPRFNPVSLIPPMVKDPGTGQLRQMQLGDSPTTRVFQPTLFNMTINVPKFQPANTNGQVSLGGALVPNSAGSLLPQGYFGRVRAFVDSNGNGLLDGTPQEAYRGFNLMTSVDVDEKISVSTPTVNLGTLAEGTGYSPLRPGKATGTQAYDPTGASNGAGIFEPWAGNYSGLFQPFTVLNQGNVNLLNVRVAKGSQLPYGNPPTINANPTPWGIYSASNDTLGYLDGFLDLWSDIDTTFAPVAPIGQQVAFQKGRVTDVSPPQLTANMVRRANANLGTTGTFIPSGTSIPLPDVLNKTQGAGGAGTLLYPPVAPRVGVSIPIGMPVGPYSQIMRVFEDANNSEIWSMFNGAPETYSDPTFTLNFNIRESQLTTSPTPYTASMLDNLAPASAANPLSYSNIQPAMVRDPNGGLIVAFSSDRPNWTPTAPALTTDLGSYRLYFGNLNNGAKFGSFGVTGSADPFSPISDLNNFLPGSNTQWFNQGAAGYPTQAPDVLFSSQTGESVIGSTVKFGNPAFPTGGLTNPFAASSYFSDMFMVFTGSAQKSVSGGRIGESAIFITKVTPSSGGTVGTPPQPIGLLTDTQSVKGKPAVVQTASGALVFYPATAAGTSNVYYSYFDGTKFGPSVALPFGNGFQSVTGVSASGRVYNGVGNIFKPGDSVVDLTFTGQVEGHANPEVYLGHMKLSSSNFAVVDANGLSIDNPASDQSAFVDFAEQDNEILVASGQSGEYRALGMQWDPAKQIVLAQTLNGVTTSLLVAGSETYDRQTGIISFQTLLGGKVYFDTTLGTVRFATTTPSSSAQILLTYTPRFLRVSAGGGAGYAKATVMYDHRQISNAAPWHRPSGAFAVLGDDITNDRLVFTYNRGADSPSTPGRPYITTARFGIQLPARIATDNLGNPVNLILSGSTRANSAYELDPANGRIYFTGLDEDNTINVRYTALKEDNTTTFVNVTLKVGLVSESSEVQIPIDGTVTESDLTAFLDPYSFLAASSRRPPLIWLFWSSSRAGTPNVFFETISPQWSPVPIQQ